MIVVGQVATWEGQASTTWEAHTHAAQEAVNSAWEAQAWGVWAQLHVAQAAHATLALGATVGRGARATGAGELLGEGHRAGLPIIKILIGEPLHLGTDRELQRGPLLLGAPATDSVLEGLEVGHGKPVHARAEP